MKKSAYHTTSSAIHFREIKRDNRIVFIAIASLMLVADPITSVHTIETHTNGTDPPTAINPCIHYGTDDDYVMIHENINR